MSFCNSKEASSTSSPSSKFITKLAVKCKHDVVSPLKTVTYGANKGKKFYGCPLWQSDNCNFFLWEHDAKKIENGMPMDAEKITILKENEKLKEELDKMKVENKMLLEKMCKLRMKKKFLEVEGRRASKAEKDAMRVAVLSCFFTAIVLSILVGRM